MSPQKTAFQIHACCAGWHGRQKPLAELRVPLDATLVTLGLFVCLQDQSDLVRHFLDVQLYYGVSQKAFGKSLRSVTSQYASVLNLPTPSVSLYVFQAWHSAFEVILCLGWNTKVLLLH